MIESSYFHLSSVGCLRRISQLPVFLKLSAGVLACAIVVGFNTNAHAQITPTVTITGSATRALEGTDAVFTLTRSVPYTYPLTVNISVTQTGQFIETANSYRPPQQVVFSAAQSTATLSVETNNDAEHEAHGAVIAILQAGTGYTLGAAGTHTATVEAVDDDQPPTEVHLFRGDSFPEEENRLHSIVVVVWTQGHRPPTVSIPVRVWLVGGTAEEGVDFVGATHSFEFGATDFTYKGSRYEALKSADMIDILDDTEEEGDETFGATMTLEQARGFVTVMSPEYPDALYITIRDNDGPDPPPPLVPYTPDPDTGDTGATTPLGEPRNLTASAGDSSVTLQWTAEAGSDAVIGPTAAYQYRVSADGGRNWNPDWTTIPGGANARSYNVRGLSNGAAYTFEVRAMNGIEEGPAARMVAVPRPSASLLFPVQAGTDTEEFAISNTASEPAPLMFRAFDDAGSLRSGPGIADEMNGMLLPHQTLTFDLQEMFGPDATPKTVAAVEIASGNARTIATTIGRTAGGSFATHFEMPIGPAYFPFDRRGPAEIPVLGVTNASMPAAASLTLRTADGVDLISATRFVESGGSVREPLDTLFGIDPDTLPLSGYVVLRAPGIKFRGGLLDNPGTAAHVAPGLVGARRERIVFPFFTAGDGWNTIVTLINPSTSTLSGAFVTVTAFDRQGTRIAHSFTNRIDPGARRDLDLAAILEPGGNSVSGYFVLDIERTTTNPFVSAPRLAGMVRVIAGQQVSAAVPLLQDTGEEFFFTPTRSDGGEYTGLSILNTGTNPMEVTVEAFASSGVSLDTAVLSIPSWTGRIQLVRDLLPGLGTQDIGYLRVSSTTAQMTVIAARGQMDLTELLLLRPQTPPRDR